MAPDNTHDEADDDDVDYTSPPEGADTSKAEAALKAKLSRKRTKTGCLTCRKRRIKCDEQRPVCKNCIKSKRHCDGYSQRIMFRPPHFEYRPAPNGGAHITFQAGPMAAPMLPVFPGQVPQYMFDPNAYTATVPRPEAQFMPYAQQPQGYVGLTPQQMPLSGFPVPPQPMPVQYPAPSIAEYGWNSVDQQQQQQQQQQQPAQASFQPSFYTSGMQSIPTRVQTLPTSHWQNPISQSQQYTPSQPSEVVQTPSAVQGRTESTSTTATSMATPAPHQMPQTSITPPQKVEFVQTPVTRDSSSSWSAPNYKPRPELSHPIDYQPRAQSMHGLPQTTPLPPQPVPSAPDLMAQHTSDHPTPDLYEHQAQFQGTQTYTQWLTEAAVEVCDDDYYDVDSDEDMDIDKPVVQVQDAGRQRTLNKVLMKQHFDVRNMQIRRYDTFLQSGMLDRYNVEQHANPLKNPATARVFAHFIAATGPSLSAFERHPVNSSVLFTEGSVPFSQQGLWTYTMPMAALHHQGLLHAMLALSSLHIARLQGASVTPSIQHYAWALKRIHSCVGSQNPKKRLQVTTIAASMLLGFYEIMTADHMKWNTHLMGAKQLFIETDFAGMTRQYRKLKREKMARDQLQRRRNSISGFFNDQDDFQSSFHDVDEAMISTFVGREVRYEGFGYVEAMESKIPPPLDLSNFEILKDLFWWYCKQDAYQSIVSGNPLLMDYSRWADCPPRAAMGRPDAVYGSFDHLILLLGRIADFSAKDRPRKLKQMALNGGQWRPPPSMNMPRPPQPPPGQPPAQGPPPAQAGPAFFGMAPPPRQNVQMPSSYRSAQNTQVPQDPSSPEAFDIQAATDAALEEYGRIRAALRAFKNALSGEGFQHLAEDCHTPLQTSFGPALFYRSYDIGCLWSIYNMCEIIAIRSHPHMHPAMHAAAAIAAKETTYYAEQIGRIAAGIVPGPSNEPLNPTLGSALCESCMPSFFAAIQYQGAQQRKETIMRILSISFRTGWGSAELIAAGIETSWVKAAEAGRGPPYQRAMRPQYSEDPRLNGSWQRIDPNEQVDESEMDDSDRRLVKSKANARLNWAVGVIGTEDDLKN